MRKLLFFFLTLLCLGTGRAWAEPLTWTSGVAFSSGNVAGNWTFGWFNVIAPFDGSISNFKLNLGTGSPRTNAYLAFSEDAKATNTGFTASDFVGISSNSCGTSESLVTMNFDTPVQLKGNKKYYVYFVTESAGVYTTVEQRFYVVASTIMGWGAIKSTTATRNDYAVPFTADLTPTEAYYRIKCNFPENTYLCSSASNENKLWKFGTTPTLTDSRSAWHITYNEGMILQNEGNSHFIPKFTYASKSGDAVNYLSATTIEDAEKFTPQARMDIGILYVKLKSSTYSGDTWLDTYSSSNNNVGCHNAEHKGNPFLFQAVTKVTFSEAVAVNGGDAVSTIYVARDGSELTSLPANKLYTIGGVEYDYNDAVTAINAATASQVDVIVKENAAGSLVTYKLTYNGSVVKTQEVTAVIGAPAADFMPAEFDNGFMTYTFSPETIDAGTTEVTVTATWNGPFQLSADYANAVWYTVGMHAYYENENHIWKYDGGNLATAAVPTNDYASLSDANCFCFVGDPYNGIAIYNKSAGDDVSVAKADDDTQATFNTTGTLFIPKASKEDGRTIANGFACFLVKEGSNYLNCYAGAGYTVKGWSSNDNGSTCWFIPAGQYYINHIDEFNLDAPVGAVGTHNYFTSHPDDVAAVVTMRSNIVSDLNADVSTLNTKYSLLQTIDDSGSIITLGEGYYRIVSAYTGFATKPAMYFNQNQNKIQWATSVLADADYRVHTIFKITNDGTNYHIYSPNAAKSIYSTNSGQSAVLGDLSAENASDVTFTSAGNAQYKIYLSCNSRPMHTNGHSDGAGTWGEIVAWDNAAYSPSAWYLVRVDDITVDLELQIGESYYTTLCLPFDVTLSGANAYTLKQTDGEAVLVISDPISNVPAGTPVLVIGDAATATASLASDAPYVASPLATTSLTGTFTALSGLSSDTDHFIGKTTSGENDILGFFNGGATTLKANRAYLNATHSDDGYIVKNQSGQSIGTSIDEIGQLTLDNSAIFNISGQRVNKAQRGLYIINGKKVLVK